MQPAEPAGEASMRDLYRRFLNEAELRQVKGEELAANLGCRSAVAASSLLWLPCEYVYLLKSNATSERRHFRESTRHQQGLVGT